MSPNFRIALRFLTAKKRAMLMSLSCTVLGVGLFIVTQATTNGFEDLFKQTLIGSDGAMRIEDRWQDTQRSMEATHGSNFSIGQKEGVKYIAGIEQPDLIMEAVRQFASVEGVSAIVHGNVQASSGGKNEDAQVFGIKLADHLRVSDLKRQVPADGLKRFQESPDQALVGSVLAERMQLEIGQSFVLKAGGESRRYRVAGIYETGYRDIDKVRIFLSFNEARSLLKKPTGASFIQISLKPWAIDQAPQEAARMAEVLRHNVKPWQDREKPWLVAFGALRISSAITVSIFTLIASLAMFNTLAMIVIEKTKDIAILRSMGYERRDITQIFLWQAVVVLAIGAVLGALFGAVVTHIVGQLPLPITGIFKTAVFPILSQPSHYFEAIVTAAIMVMIASLVPARRAARLEPGDIIRGTSQ